MKPQISVIIPAYNAAKTVEKTVRNVLASTIPVHVYVVDDGSTDETAAILDRIAAEEGKEGVGVEWNGSALTVLHQVNTGAYQARLNALKLIKTPYFGFVDADDTISAEMYEKMLGFAEEERLDVVRCSYDGATDLGAITPDGFIADTREAVFEAYVLPALIEGAQGGTFIWNVLYRHQYDFEKFDPTDRDTNFDDMIFNLQFFLKIERMGFLSEKLYHYATTEGSAIHRFGKDKLKDFREVCRVRRTLLPLYGIEAKDSRNLAWFRRNRMNCLKSLILAKNLNLSEKLSLAIQLLKEKM